MPNEIIKIIFRHIEDDWSILALLSRRLSFIIQELRKEKTAIYINVGSSFYEQSISQILTRFGKPLGKSFKNPISLYKILELHLGLQEMPRARLPGLVTVTKFEIDSGVSLNSAVVGNLLNSMPNLEEFCCWSPVLLPVIQCIEKLPKISSLKMAVSYRSGPYQYAFFHSLISIAPKLKHLALFECNSMNSMPSDDLKNLGEKCCNLESLELRNLTMNSFLSMIEVLTSSRLNCLKYSNEVGDFSSYIGQSIWENFFDRHKNSLQTIHFKAHRFNTVAMVLPKIKELKIMHVDPLFNLKRFSILITKQANSLKPDRQNI